MELRSDLPIKEFEAALRAFILRKGKLYIYHNWNENPTCFRRGSKDLVAKSRDLPKHLIGPYLWVLSFMYSLYGIVYRHQKSDKLLKYSRSRSTCLRFVQ